MDSISDITKKFTEMSEWISFSEAQTKSILELQKKIQKLEEENVHLKNLLSVNAANIPQGADGLPVVNETTPILLCEIELEKLRQLSMIGPLTYEEAKKMDIYIKNLVLLRNNRQGKSNPMKDVSDEDLLKVIDIVS